MTMHTRALVIGLGNPLLGDDGVGIVASRLVRDVIAPSEADVVEVYAGGLRLLDAMVGYRRVINVDALMSGVRGGSVHRLDVGELRRTKNLTSTHDTNLATALELGRTIGMEIPDHVRIVGVEVVDTSSFKEALSAVVAAALPTVVREVVDFVRLHRSRHAHTAA
ncbi:MAG: hydrogenase maturation protease [Polyangiaceae bacterium]